MFFLSFYLEGNVVANISLSFDWLSILIRVSKNIFSFFFYFRFTLKLVWRWLSRSVLTGSRFWFELRKCDFRCFRFISFQLFVLELVWEWLSPLVSTAFRFCFEFRKSVFDLLSFIFCRCCFRLEDTNLKYEVFYTSES